MYLTSYIQSSNMLFETFALEQGTMISNKSVIFFFTIKGTDGRCKRDQTVLVTHMGFGNIGQKTYTENEGQWKKLSDDFHLI